MIQLKYTNSYCHSIYVETIHSNLTFRLLNFIASKKYPILSTIDKYSGKNVMKAEVLLLFV